METKTSHKILLVGPISGKTARSALLGAGTLLPEHCVNVGAGACPPWSSVVPAQDASLIPVPPSRVQFRYETKAPPSSAR